MSVLHSAAKFTCGFGGRVSGPDPEFEALLWVGAAGWIV